MRSLLAVATGVLVSLSCAVPEASAQAFLPPSGEGSITVGYQGLFARGHLDLQGDRMIGESGHDPTRGHVVQMEAELGVTNRLALGVSLPYIRSRYGGTHPHRVLGVGPPQEWDNGEYHGTFQDVRAGVRYNIARRLVVITPFAEIVVPSHHYQSNAHAAVGKDLRAYVVGGAVGGFLDPILPRLYFQAAVSYARVQQEVGIRPNRSRVESELGYFLSPRLSVRLLESYQVTHHGIDLLSFTPMVEGVIHGHPEIPFTGEYRRNHDRLQRSNYLTLGGGLGWSVNDSVDVFVSGAQMVWGENVHPLRAISVGMSTRLHTRRTGPGPSSRGLGNSSLSSPAAATRPPHPF
jgi:hypothetical protein